jgi:hypothetical protein
MSAASERSLGPHAFLIGAYAQSLWLRVAASAFTSPEWISFRLARNPLATGREVAMKPPILSGERVFLGSEKNKKWPPVCLNGTTLRFSARRPRSAVLL